MTRVSLIKGHAQRVFGATWTAISTSIRSLSGRAFLADLAQRLQQGVRATIDALGQSHAQRLAAIVENSDDAILSVDLEGTIATWNRGAEQLYGYEAEEIIGKSVNVLIPADRQDEEPGLLEARRPR